ncbi:MAG TPA: hypothetical protein VM243_07040 [Phycisphaerae bacterium]|nr:hypothetical protein [Phycisphaerae bacterium]
MSLSDRALGVGLIALLAVAAPSWGQMPKRVQVVGRAAGTDVRAGDEAVKAAQRAAVEQACGLFINAQSQTEEYALVKDRILSQAGGYVTEYTELRRWTEGEVTLVEIDAVVAVADFERDWAAFTHLKEDEGNPRMMVVIIEDNDVDDLKPPVLHGVCQSRIEHFFLGKDVQLMDKGVSDEVRDRDVNQAALDDDLTRLAAVAAEFKAEVLVYGRAEARRGASVQLGDQFLYGWDVTLNVRAVQADSAAILMSNTYRPSKAYRTTSGAAGDDAFRVLADDVAAQVLKDIAKAWHKRGAARRILSVKFADVDRQQAKAIMAALAAHRGTVNGPEGATLRNLNHGVADIEVDWKFDLNLLADTIEELGVEGMAFEVIEQSGNRLDVKVIHE